MSSALVAGLMLALVIVGLILSSTGDGGLGLSVSESSTGGLLLFSGRTDDGHSIFVASADGKRRWQITDEDGSDFEPVWSPDGTRIAFARYLESQRRVSLLLGMPSGSPEVFVVNLDGTGLRQLTNDGFRVSNLAWSPDGQSIAYTAQIDGQRSRIFIVDVESGASRPLLEGEPGTETDYSDGALSWSPDGSRIMFMRFNPDRPVIYLVHADGSTFRPLTELDRPGFHGPPFWSPDGAHVVFTAGEPRPNVMTLNVESGEVRSLTSHDRSDFGVAWSPDARQIVFVSRFDAADEGVYVVNADGAGLRRLFETDGDVMMPSWSSDGSRIAFTGFYPDGTCVGCGDWRVHVIDANGANLRTVYEQKTWPILPVQWHPESSSADEALARAPSLHR